MKKGCLLNTTIKFPTNFKHTGTWKQKTWNGLTGFVGHNVWTDGSEIYYSGGSGVHYVLNGDTWEPKTWNIGDKWSGLNVWSDGTNIYHSKGDEQYVLNGDTWEAKSWNKPDDFDLFASSIWTDGANIYWSQYQKHYVLNGDTWTQLDWDLQVGSHYRGGLYGIWSDGEHVYYSGDAYQYILNGDKWEETNRNTDICGNFVWTDGTNIYHSRNVLIDQSNVLKDGVWEDMVWGNLPYFTGSYVWSDGTNIYYSNGAEQYVLEKQSGAEWKKHDAYKPNTKWDGQTFYTVIGNKWVKHDAYNPQGGTS